MNNLNIFAKISTFLGPFLFALFSRPFFTSRKHLATYTKTYFYKLQETIIMDNFWQTFVMMALPIIAVILNLIILFNKPKSKLVTIIYILISLVYLLFSLLVLASYNSA